VQERLAKELHQQAGVPEGACGIEELKKFQSVLGPRYQLLVMSFCKPFMLIFKGPAAEFQIRLVKSNHHYDGCTSFPAFVNKSYYCLECEKGFNHDDVAHHRCQGRKCNSCNRKTCPDYRIGSIPSERCPDCFCFFYGPDCCLFHRSGTSCGKYRT